MELWKELQQKVDDLDVSVRSLRKTGTDFAEAEKNYKLLLRLEILKLRDEKMPVTIIEKVAYGIPEVAEKRFKRDVAEAIYKANMESINAIKTHIGVLREQRKEEWGVAKYETS